MFINAFQREGRLGKIILSSSTLTVSYFEIPTFSNLIFPTHYFTEYSLPSIIVVKSKVLILREGREDYIPTILISLYIYITAAKYDTILSLLITNVN